MRAKNTYTKILLKAVSSVTSTPILQSRPQALTVRNMQQMKAQLTAPVGYLRGQSSKMIPQQYLKNGMRQQLATRPPPVYKKYVSPAKSYMTQAASLPLGVPAFKPIPPKDPNDNVNEILKINTLPPIQSKFYGVTNNQVTKLLISF